MIQRPENDVVSERVDRALSSAIDLHGPSLLLEPAKLTSYLELAAERTCWQTGAVVAAIPAEVPQQMLAAYSEDHLVAILPGLVDRLTKSARLDRGQATWTVRTWAKALALSTKGLDGAVAANPAAITTSAHRASIAEVLGSGLRPDRIVTPVAPVASSIVVPTAMATPIDDAPMESSAAIESSMEPASTVEAPSAPPADLASSSSDLFAIETLITEPSKVAPPIVASPEREGSTLPPAGDIGARVDDTLPRPEPIVVELPQSSVTSTPLAVARAEAMQGAGPRRAPPGWAALAIVGVVVVLTVVALRGVLSGPSSTGLDVRSGAVVGRVTEVPVTDHSTASATGNTPAPEAPVADAPTPQASSSASSSVVPQPSPPSATVVSPPVQPASSPPVGMPPQIMLPPVIATPTRSPRDDRVPKPTPRPSPTRATAVAKTAPAREAAPVAAAASVACTRASCGSVVAVRAPTDDGVGLPPQFAHNYEMTIRMDDRSIHALLQPLPLKPGTRVRMTGNRFVPIPSQ